jgi:uncharacterized protein (DUF2147 family)
MLAPPVTPAPPPAAFASAPASPLGVWSNPYGSVRVAVEVCGGRLCGRVVWASAEAIADASSGSGTPLVGAQLLRAFARAGERRWRGAVFVPDFGRSFSGTMALLDSGRMAVRGCILGGLICRQQIWRRAG